MHLGFVSAPSGGGRSGRNRGVGTGRVPDEKRGHEFVIAENGALPARRFSRSPLYFGIYLHFSITKKKKVSSKCSVGGPSSTNVHSGRRRRARKRAEGAPAEIAPSGRGPRSGSRIAAPATCVGPNASSHLPPSPRGSAGLSEAEASCQAGVTVVLCK